MKKLFLSFVLASMLFVCAPVINAQEVVAPTQQELTQQLITLLTQMIQMLQKQIADILAAQATQQTALNQIAQNTTPPVTSLSTFVATFSTPPLNVSCDYSPNPAVPNEKLTFRSIASGGVGNYIYKWDTNVGGHLNGDGEEYYFDHAQGGKYTLTTIVKSGNEIKSATCEAPIQ